MAKKPTFLIRDAKGQIRGDPVPYTPLLVTAGTETHKLALHQNCGAWQISDPISGGKLLNVSYRYKGLPVSSNARTLREIRPFATADLDLLIQRVGAEKFNQVLAQARANAKEA